MTVDQVWDLLFADDAIYDLKEAQASQGDKIVNQGSWTKPDSDSQESILERTVQMKTKVPKNPFVKYAQAKNDQYVRKHTGSELIIDETTAGSGFMYADSLIVHTSWEVYSLKDGSDKSIVRHSWHLEWVDKPYFVSSII